MTVWEYVADAIAACDMAARGQAGWELTAVHDGVAFFKRVMQAVALAPEPVPSPPPPAEPPPPASLEEPPEPAPPPPQFPDAA